MMICSLSRRLALPSLLLSLSSCQVTGKDHASSTPLDSAVECQTATHKNKTLEISASIFNSASLQFKSHQGRGYYDNYLSMELPYTPVKGLFDKLEDLESISLKTRGEAHITVLSPVEFHDLKNYVSIEEMEKIAKSHNVQSSQFDIQCLGQGQSPDHSDSTYFVVVSSLDLVNIRRDIAKLYADRSGEAGAFVAEDFYPHITVGFTSRDLHIQDGVCKDQRTCIYDIEVVNGSE